DEVRPRAGFEDELGALLRDSWTGKVTSVSTNVGVPAGRRWTTTMAWAAAVVALLGGIGFVAARDHDSDPTVGTENSVDTSVTPTVAPTTVPPATSTAPATTEPDVPSIEPITITVDANTPTLFGETVFAQPIANVHPWVAAVTPSGRVFFGGDADGSGSKFSVSEVIDGALVPTDLVVEGTLVSGLDERLYELAWTGQAFRAYREVSPQHWVLDGTLTDVGECGLQIHPTAMHCGGQDLPMTPTVAAADIEFNADLLVTAATATATQNWQLTPDFTGASIGECTDDQCLIHRPLGPDGVLWTPVLDTGSVSTGRLAVALRPGKPTVVGWLPIPDGSIIGVVGNTVYTIGFGSMANGAPATVVQRFDLDAPPLVTPSTPEETSVLQYLTALADARYDDAAALIGQGGLELENRADLRPLLDNQGALPSLADSLKSWCESAMCRRPSAMHTDGSRVVADFMIDGVARSSTFVGATFEGSPLVMGLPLQLPPAGISMGDTVACPTANIERTLFADLNGDGWLELLTLQTADGGGAPFRVTACGTTLVMHPFEVPDNAQPLMYTLDIEGDGTSELLLGGYVDPIWKASVYRLEGDTLTATGQSVQQAPPLDTPTGTSFGCLDLDGDGTRDLVGFTYQYVGGTDLSNSTALTYDARIIRADGPNGPSTAGTLALPANETQAFHVIAPYCEPVQVQTG
ncbi:MAG: hypothetical protein RLZZ623_1591, partial [Actinomycetota bacterium]